MKPKRDRRYRDYHLPTAIDKASGNSFAVEGQRGYRKSKAACLNGSWRLRKRRPITLAQRA